MQAIFESVFDISYLVLVIILGFIMTIKTDNKTIQTFGIMTLILGFGDAFHLVPRIYVHLFNGHQNPQIFAYLGFGKLVTSITMTVFYILLFIILKQLFNKQWQGLTLIVFVLAAIRIILCLMPQNMWFSANPPLSWGIIRNIPFLILGTLDVVAYYLGASSSKDIKYPWLPIAVILSFLFYIPVVLFAGPFPPIGALMLPKTICYVWVVIIGFKLYQREQINMQ